VGTSAELQMVDNMLPRAGMENPGPVQAAVKELHYQRRVSDLPGFGKLATWNSVPATPATAAFVHTTQYLARRSELISDQAHSREPRPRGTNVLAVDVGGTTTTAAVVLEGLLDLVVCKKLGLSHSATRILDHVPPDSVLGWLPFSLDPVEVHNSLHSKTEHPHTLPQTRQDLFVEQAAAREILCVVRSSLADGRQAQSDLVPDLKTQFDLIVGSGGVLVNAPNPGQAALVLIDGLQPVGICNLVLDRLGLMAAVGTLAEAFPSAAVQVAERDLLRRLGTVIAPVGTTREGETALTCRIEYNDGRALELAVPYGSMEVLPLPAGQWANLRVQPTNRFEVGFKGRGRAITTRVEGGDVGVIIDARGRPLKRAKDPEVQQARNQHWLWHIGSPTS
jgi:hypothetical protein